MHLYRLLFDMLIPANIFYSDEKVFEF